MSVIVKGDSPFDAFIVSGIKGCHTEHIKFYNISFNCKTIEDADGRVFTRREERKTEWTPCSETVDIPDHEVLACDKRGEEIFGYLEYADDQWICASEDCVMYDPIAWMEKPEPYHGEGNRDE